ncbi:MAG: hypothetical protein ACHQ01_00855 [Candidatus Limnocylindrales bacterium]
MRFRNTAITVVIFGVAMAYLESAVVVYLQRALSISPDALFPLQGTEIAGNLAAIEVGREFATLVMLVAIGSLVGRRWVDRLAWTAVAFGVWDVFYYVWLWVFISWPHSPSTWDVLFLLPVPWAGPVWAPVAVSLALVGFGLAAARRAGDGDVPRVGLVRGMAALAGGMLVVLSFAANGPALLAGRMPGEFPWPVFVGGMAVAGWAAVASLGAGTAKTSEAG